MATPLYCYKCSTHLPAESLFCPACGMLQTDNDHAPTNPSRHEATLFSAGRQPAGRLLHQRYRLLQTISQGGMGAVYAAQDTQLGNRLVAVKEMSVGRLAPQDISQAVERFRREAHLLTNLHHPSLPAIHEYFQEQERWYLVMSFIEGQNLQAVLQAVPGNKLPLQEAVHIGLALCDVLEYLHTHEPQVIFRDLKPLNIMLTPKGDICLIDFGIARHFKQEQTKDMAYSCSVGYAPPEQYGQAQTGPRSDIYSLGATLHQMVSGQNPAKQPFQFVQLRLIDPTLPTPLATLIAQMLEMSEQARPASVAEVKAQLEQVLISKPVEPVANKTSAKQAKAQPLESHRASLEPRPPFFLLNARKVAERIKTRASQRVVLLGMVVLLIVALGSGVVWFTRQRAVSVGCTLAPPATGLTATPQNNAVGQVIEYPVPTFSSGASGITAGPDGNLWFTELYGNKIGRITVSGIITEYPIPTSSSGASGITKGPDGNLWFAESLSNKIGRITPNGNITEYPIPTSGSSPSGITVGPDGNLWFTEYNSGKIGRITPGGTVTEFSVPVPQSHPEGITAGSDGNLWFTIIGTINDSNEIGRITPRGVVTEYMVQAQIIDSSPDGITAGPDGNLWFTEYASDKIGRITPKGVMTEYAISTSGTLPSGIIAGPDGNLWFTEYASDKIGCITLKGVVTEYPIPTVDSGPDGITAGPDGNLWFIEYNSNKIGRITSGK